ncbi:redox-sensing transcriptional repressor [Pilibacter termitis]|uniref:Redox-sensing transcriptional repressor Rex n=1 Tax=Pilibacter termitis TaxID=263852 RepID=A0A1T4NPS1_9ENTE|nr:redox-sensing transcriptional repressor Rex [Pilibacter termitis]SJZ81280.1 redox-sensing transcriptional repressor [Pilibacter termitis]
MNTTEEKKIPKATAKRFPLYLRYLKMLQSEGIERIQSHTFSEVTQVPSATIRRDFSYIGELGRSGFGYEVNKLIEVFGSFLNIETEEKIALVGCGNLGRALLNNNFRRNDNLQIICAFDSNPEVIGQKISGVEVFDIADFPEIVKEQNIMLAISTVPSQFAQDAVEKIVEGNVKAILSFAPDRVKVPADVTVQYIDLTNEVQTLLFYEQIQRK